ncbi:VWA domain-containing protein [Veronia pacifica]|uniref:IMP dehydrogenase n=1 Tax=Veronia pacifica TaxID=1080227 RepID=A0A1C3EMM0_9GAMM|nr:VWA domain-containing protein [Veronia pacifica]ODA34465.1 IMP dehydrogenase [Veronia pacifica]
MIELVWPFSLLLIPLPWLLYKVLPAVSPPPRVRMPRLPNEFGKEARDSYINYVVMAIIWLLLVTAISRPVWVGDPVRLDIDHRDILIAVDLSRSMETEDMKDADDKVINRLSAVKTVLKDFISRRQGDRLGLVIFADHAYLQTPLTFDLNTVIQQLDRAVLGLIGDRTAIGEALGIATKTFIDNNANQRVVILLSDGANTSGVLNPIEAAGHAERNNVTVYTVGVGAEDDGKETSFRQSSNNPALSLDERTLTDVAKKTGGQYFRARDPEELETIYQLIEKLEPVSEATQSWRPRDELFRYPLGIAVAISVAVLIFARESRG